MERLTDKGIVLACCLAGLAGAVLTERAVALLLLAVSVAAAGEALRDELVSRALAVAYLVLVCVAGEGLVGVPLMAYELARSPARPAPAALAALPILVAGRGGVAPGHLAFFALVGVAAVLLAQRTSRTLVQRADNLRTGDELRERSLRLEERNRDLVSGQEYEVRLATLAERTRIAREIHDNVGHLLTRGMVQAEALRIVHAGEPGVAADFADVSATLGAALDEMRSSVHDLRDDACDLAVQLRHLAETSCADTGLTCTCAIEAADVPAPVASCLLAVAREALSNALRHAAGATRVRVEFVEHPGLWRLLVADDGARPAALPAEGAAPAHGMGLASMEERVRALTGTLAAGYEDTGWVVRASVPRPRVSSAERGGAA